jgi:hypothetical protein
MVRWLGGGRGLEEVAREKDDTYWKINDKFQVDVRK